MNWDYRGHTSLSDLEATELTKKSVFVFLDMSKPPACPVSWDKWHLKFNTPTSKFTIFPLRRAPSPDGPGCATTDPRPPTHRCPGHVSARWAKQAACSHGHATALVLHFAFSHLTDTALFTNEARSSDSKKVTVRYNAILG